jgi:Mg2+-importing ATPase
VLTTRREVTPLGLFLNQFKSPIVLILIFATIMSALLGDLADAVIITFIVLGSAVLSFIQEYAASTAAEKLKAQINTKVTVLRDGQPKSIPLEEVVPGDVAVLQAGSLIPADGVLLEAKDFFVSQAVLTGETFPVEKMPGATPEGAGLSERTNVVCMGTSVSSGSGKALIVQTGKATAFGQIAERLRLRPPETEFERGIRHLGYLLTEVMFFLVVMVFAINVVRGNSPVESLLFSVALAVGLTPQLLPAIININLSRGSQKMAKAGVIVRRLSAIENLGSMNVLCTDKTGTLTEGVVKLDAANDINGQPSDDVFRLAYLNAFYQTGMTNALDDAICDFKQIDVSHVTKIDEIPYDFARKRVTVVVKENERCTMICKGALEPLLKECVNMVSPDQAQAIQGKFAEWSGKGLRVLGIATKEVPEKHPYTRDDEKGMKLAGFLLFSDPPKAGVKDTIGVLNGLGVQIKIITGDNKLVAQHIAEMVGLPVTGIVTGADLSGMSEAALLHAVTKANLFVEVDPNQKERIILGLKKVSFVVGYMGDGINDAPPLHAADVGISVNNAADVAKSASDFVLLKQDLSVLQAGIVEGRRTFANTLKYIFMAVSANFGNMFSVAGASLFLSFLPMLPKQILLINFLTDFPEFTIAGDNVDQGMIEKPHRWDIGFIRRFMLVFGPLSSVFDYLTFGSLLLLPRLIALPTGSNPEALFHSTWFVESVLSATLVVLVLRTRLPFFKSMPSRLMLAATVVIAVIAVALPYSPLAALFGFVPLPLSYLVVVFVIVVLYVLSAEFTKRIFYRLDERMVRKLPGQ